MWVGLAGLLAAAVTVVALIVQRRRRDGAWLDRATTATQSVQWINDHYVPSLLVLGKSQQLQQSWQEGSARFAALDAELLALRADAPDEQRSLAAEGVRMALAGLGQSVRQVVDLAVTGAPADVQRRAAVGVQQSRDAVRGSLHRLVPDQDDR